MKSNRFTMAVILTLTLLGITTMNLKAGSCTGFTTYTQGGWGADPHGNNPGSYLFSNFAAAFPNGLTIGCGSNLLVLTTDTAVHDFLPSGGTPSTLPAGTLTNPGQGYSNTFAGQLVAVTLNVIFDQYDPNFSSNSIHVADLVVQSGPFAGQTVSQVIAEANNVIGGCSTSYTVDDLNTALDNINNNYDNGTSDDGFLSCSSGCTISLSGTSTNITCYGSSNGSIDIGVSGAQGSVSYLWNDGATTQDRTGLAPGKYWVTATDQGSCKASDTFNISQPDSIHLSQTHINVSITGGSDGSIDLSVSGGTGSYTYLWSNGATTQDLSGLKAGSYSVVVTDHNGCQDSLAIIITQPDCSLSLDGTTTNVTCYGSANGSIDVTVSGAQGTVGYLWNDGATTQDRTSLAPGKYWVTATDQGGCAASDTFSISQPDSIHLSQTHINVSVTGGSDGSIDLTVSGGTGSYNYLWSNGATTQDLSGLKAGTYSVIVTDHNGCQDSLAVIITQPNCSLFLNGTTSNDKCYGSANGSIDVTVSGAQGSVSYLWNDGVTTQDRSGLTMGTYSVTATDQGGCAASDTFLISQPDSIHISATHVNVSSSGAHDGSITLTVTGGTPPYKYLWSNGKKTKNLKNIGAGTYTVVVTDANGCTATITVVITVSTCACVPPTNITFGPPIKNKVQVCWGSVPCATGYIIKWKLSNKALWQYRTINAPDTCTSFTWKPGQTDLIYFATICSDGDTTAYGQLYTYPPPSREGEVNTYPQFNVFPNPTSGHIMISLKNENFTDQQVLIDVVNIFGQIVLNDKSELVNGGLTKSIELPNGLAPGMYMVNVTVGNKILHQQIVFSGK